jgi:hypothetical protein
MRFASLIPLVLIATLSLPQPALAWGAYGHRIINGDAARALPADLPDFLRTPEAIAEIAVLGPEADRIRGSGKTRDADYDPAHFLDLEDDGTVAEAVKLSALPPTREAYDTALRSGPPVKGVAPDQYNAGWVPYEIVDGFELVVKDFAIWRVDRFGETNGAPADHAFFAADRRLREDLILRDIGYWGHFVADASQPLHISVHFNGWGDYPNPNNYSQSHTIHARFETAFVNAHASPEAVLPLMTPYAPSTAPILSRVETYLATTNSFVPAVYRLEAAGAFDAGTPAAVTFTLERLAAGASVLRDLIADAYAASLDAKVGYPAVTVRDVLAGSVALKRSLADGG